MTNKLCLFAPSSCTNSFGDWDWLICSWCGLSSQYRAVSWPWLLVPYFSGAVRSGYYVYFGSIGGLSSFWSFLWFYLDLSLGHGSLPLDDSFPLAACLAVGAALGANRFGCLCISFERFRFPKRVSNILKGEGLLNDASGLVAFQMALAAWTTGTFFSAKLELP